LSGEAKVDNSILEPAITLFTDQWTPGVTVARAFTALRCSSAYHVRQDIMGIAAVKSTTSLPLYYLLCHLSQDSVVSSSCIQRTQILDSATLQYPICDKMKLVIVKVGVVSNERICNVYVLCIYKLVLWS